MQNSNIKFKINGLGIFITLLVVLLLASFSYIVYDKFQENRQKVLTNSFQNGFQVGYENAIIQLMAELPNCKPFPIYANNITYDIIATECFNQYLSANSSVPP